MMKKLIVVLLFALAPLSSHALIQARLGFDTHAFDDDPQNGHSVDDATGLTADFIFNPPVVTDLGLGLRYEMLGFDYGAGRDASLDRLSFLVNYRFIDTLLYVGVIGTVGIKTDMEVESGGQKYSYDDDLNYSIGAEAGVHLAIFSIGAEIGKFFGKFDAPLADGGGEFDAGSLYFKGIVGIGF